MSQTYTLALTLLSSRELSEHQLRERLGRRECPGEEIDEVVARLLADGTLNDRRVAAAMARLEGGIRHRGRIRVLQKLRGLGIDESTATAAVDDVFGDLDERSVLDQAIVRRLKGRSVATLDPKERARLVRGLIAQGFRTGDILSRLRVSSSE
jgi:regulatory protein